MEGGDGFFHAILTRTRSLTAVCLDFVNQFSFSYTGMTYGEAIWHLAG